MDIEQIRDYCLSLREDVEECMPFDDVNLVYKVDGKMFALLNLNSSNIALKCDPELAIELRETYDYVTGAFHFNKKHWNGIDRNQAKAEQIRQWIKLSFDLVKKEKQKNKDIMKPTLLVLAAGMGSRYGGLKQLDAFGPSGETIIDYSVFDACRAGFGKVVFVIREEFEKEFKEKISDKYKSKIAVELVYQSLSNIPSGYSLNKERVKPLGTGHAVWCAKDKIGEQFAVINADDFYGPASFSLICGYLKELEDKDIAKQTMVGYKLTNTLSENGHVSRGVCELCPETQKLKSITERTQICHTDRGVVFVENEVEHKLSGEEVVSMNMMGFTSVAMEHFDKDLREFLDENQKDLKKEFYLPTVLNNLIQRGYSCVKVLETSEKWFGVTYPEDKPTVVAAISKLHSAGSYPHKLW